MFDTGYTLTGFEADHYHLKIEECFEVVFDQSNCFHTASKHCGDARMPNLLVSIVNRWQVHLQKLQAFRYHSCSTSFS